MKAVPGHGGGEWLQRDWDLEGGSGTRVSVQSPAYVDLTASVSKAARGIKDETTRRTAGEKDINEEAKLTRGKRKVHRMEHLGPEPPSSSRTPAVRTVTHKPFHPQVPDRQVNLGGISSACYWMVHVLLVFGVIWRNRTISYLFKLPLLCCSLLFAVKTHFNKF